jgi:hypothetical protein
MADPIATPTPTTPTPAPAGASPASPAEPTGIAKYKSLDELKTAFKSSPQYLKLTAPARVASFDVLTNKWNEYQASQQQEQQQTQQAQPDLMGRVSQFVNRHTGNLPQPEREFVQALVPPNNAQAAIDVALFAAGGPLSGVLGPAAEAVSPLARLGMRLAIPAAAGAAGGAIQGGAWGAAKGAGLGIGQQLGAEGISFARGIAGKALQKADVGRVTDWLNDSLNLVPTSKNRFENVTDISREFIGGESDKKLGEKVGKLEGRLGKQTVDMTVDQQMAGILGIPPGQHPVAAKDALHALNTLEDLGWDSQFRLSRGRTAQAARSAAHQVEEDIAHDLNVRNPKLASEWLTARHQYRMSRTLSNLFREDGVIEKGKLNPQRFQELLGDAGPKGYKMDLELAAGPDAIRDVQELGSAARRGAPPGATDITGEKPGVRVGIHGLGHPPGLYFHPGTPSKHIGNIPFDLGRGRAFTGVMVLGAHEFVHRLDKMLSPDGEAN